jgi:hypothetical protein
LGKTRYQGAGAFFCSVLKEKKREKKNIKIRERERER